MVVDFLLLLIVPFASSLMVQIMGLEIIRAVMLPFVLPAGVVLRIFPPTRDAGAYLIAVAIGFQVVFPFTYVMHKHIVQDMMLPGTSLISINTLSQSLTDPNILLSIIKGTPFNFEAELFHPIELLSYLLLQALFLPALSITLTIAFIKSFTKFVSQKLG